MALTPDQAARSLQEAARKAPQLNADALRRIADLAVAEIEAVWPVLTGRSQEGWVAKSKRDGAAVANPVSYASDVHNGLASTLVPETLKGLDDAWEKELNKTLTPILERG
jgi:hypothetical protein